MDKEYLAYALGILTADGHYQKDRDLVSFYAKDKEELNRCKEIFLKLGFSKISIYEDLSKGKSKASNLRYKLFLTESSRCRVLSERGLPPGNKTNIQFNVPKWIIKGNRKVKASYLRGLMDGEGSIYPTKRKNGKPRWRIAFAMCKNQELYDDAINFFESLRTILLENFEIKSSPIRVRKENIRKDGSKSMYFRFEIESSQFDKFYKEIGFSNSEKKRRLESCIS